MSLPSSIALPNNIIFHLDDPHESIVRSSGFLIQGWAIEEHDQISNVSIYLSGNKLADISKKAERPDVKNTYPNYENSKNSGFVYYVQNIPKGKQTLQITLHVSNKEFLAKSIELEVLENFNRNEILDKMKQDWNKRANEDAESYVYEHYQNQQLYDARAKQHSVEIIKHLQQMLPSANLSNQRMLEIGCGVGRLAKGFSEIFQNYVGIDVSEGMVNIAREKLKDVNNAKFYANNGIDIDMVENETIDFVFEGFVFQHIPQKDIVENYCKEVFRVLKKGGHFMAYFWKNKVDEPGYKNDKLYREDDVAVTNDTIFGVQYTQPEIKNMLTNIGFTDLHFIDDPLLDGIIHHIVLVTK
jgi:ubiquinone/menaquinone biosynthesis C-methylase UbiE